MSDGLGWTLWIAEMACQDDPNEQMSEIIGVFGTEDLARAACARYGPRTGNCTMCVLDEPFDYLRPRDVPTTGPYSGTVTKTYDVRREHPRRGLRFPWR